LSRVKTGPGFRGRPFFVAESNLVKRWLAKQKNWKIFWRNVFFLGHFNKFKIWFLLNPLTIWTSIFSLITTLFSYWRTPHWSLKFLQILIFMLFSNKWTFQFLQILIFMPFSNKWAFRFLQILIFSLFSNKWAF